MPVHISETKKHFWPKVLTSLIPFRHTRRTWRNIFTMGYREYRKQIKTDKKTKFEDLMNVGEKLIFEHGNYVDERFEKMRTK